MCNIKSGYKNDWLNMLDSVEVNLKYQQQRHSFICDKYKASFRQNAWLDAGRILDNALSALPAGERCRQTRHDKNTLPVSLLSLSSPYHTLSMTLLQDASQTGKGDIYLGGNVLEEEVMPTLTRIYQRMMARREEAGIKNESTLTADESLDIALRTILKRRKRN